ncbi:uncharacterized protein ASCRUDRAFT_107138 [Ascoidea rubescens DSM 1968]|uniref:Uncharacterized protein n=1 Tax=Ascoidea rubescens DSM 1968 TaxID=1344418 RepID=A0A1D2VE90_9ASCO|nr:hypothetical protein ASCRUDRAFT_107138 [Ascoidea rubescens DSM 1968]ODV59813.1 hypothetical protein ASCRUDRAFT_107138 [Ascoidea rubescens DSM 1968]
MNKFLRTIQHLRNEAENWHEKVQQLEKRRKELELESSNKDNIINSIIFKNKTLQEDYKRLKFRANKTTKISIESLTLKLENDDYSAKNLDLESKLEDINQLIKINNTKIKENDLKIEQFQRKLYSLNNDKLNLSKQINYYQDHYNRNRNELDDIAAQLDFI